MKTSEDQTLLEYLGSFISTSKKEGIERVLCNRTRFVTVVLEDIFQPQNASAVIRSCDCFGIQDLHVIENKNEYTLNPNVAQGASKWVNIIRYNDSGAPNTRICLDRLAQEYTLYATTPHRDGISIDEIDMDRKIALIFGTELTGLSEQAFQSAHQVVKIPMFGFTESFNLSVSVALCLQTLVGKLHQSKVNWQLDEPEKQAIRLNWYRKSVKNADILERRFLDGKKV